MTDDNRPIFCLFDLDGTLTDPFPGISRCIAYALRELDVPVPGEESLRAWIGPPLLSSFRNYFDALSLDRSEDQALVLYRARFSRKGLFENRVYANVPELLESLKTNGVTLHLATAKPIVYAREILQHFKLEQFFEASYGSELDGTRTDKVDLLAYIAEQQRLDLRSGVMVGDRRHDMAAAQYHEMGAIGVTWGYGTEQELLDAGAEELVASPRALGRLLLQGIED